MVWIKCRSAAESHVLGTTVQGGNAYLIPDTSAAQASLTTYLKSFDADGFTVGLAGFTGTSGPSYLGWCWKAGTTSGITTDGSTTITPSAYSFDQTRGISIVKYTGNGTSGAKIAHGLGTTPYMVIVKRLDGSGSWDIVSTLLSDATYYIRLDTDGGQATGTWAFNDTFPDSVNFTVGDNAETNSSGGNIAYCFAPVNGFSSFGNYKGNGNASGPFIQCGFKPAFVIIKRINGTKDWMMYDNKRWYTNTNTTDFQNTCFALKPNTSVAGFASASDIDLNSQGFKIRTSGGLVNESGDNYIYMAFADEPTAFNNGDAATAREGTTMLGLNAFAENAFASIGQGYYVLVTGNKITVANNGAGVQVLAGAVAAVTGEKIVVSQNAAGVVVNIDGSVLVTTNLITVAQNAAGVTFSITGEVDLTGSKIVVSNNGAGVVVKIPEVVDVTGSLIKVKQNAAGVTFTIDGSVVPAGSKITLYTGAEKVNVLTWIPIDPDDPTLDKIWTPIDPL